MFPTWTVTLCCSFYEIFFFEFTLKMVVTPSCSHTSSGSWRNQRKRKVRHPAAASETGWSAVRYRLRTTVAADHPPVLRKRAPPYADKYNILSRIFYVLTILFPVPYHVNKPLFIHHAGLHDNPGQAPFFMKIRNIFEHWSISRTYPYRGTFVI